MPTDIIERKAKGISSKYIDQLLEYMDYLLYKSSHDTQTTEVNHTSKMHSFQRLMELREEFIRDLDDDFDPSKEYEEAINQKYGSID